MLETLLNNCSVLRVCFYRIMAPAAVSSYTAAALGYTAIAGISKEGIPKQELKRKFLNTNGSFDVSHPILLFPCRPLYVKNNHLILYTQSTYLLYRDAWHWILVAVYTKEKLLV